MKPFITVVADVFINHYQKERRSIKPVLRGSLAALIKYIHINL